MHPYRFTGCSDFYTYKQGKERNWKSQVAVPLGLQADRFPSVHSLAIRHHVISNDMGRAINHRLILGRDP